MSGNKPVPRFNEFLNFENTDEYSQEMYNNLRPDGIEHNLLNQDKKRHATLIAPAPAPDLFGSPFERSSIDFLKPPSLKRDTQTVTRPSIFMPCDFINVCVAPLAPPPKSPSPTVSLCAPDLPFLLMDTHFEVSSMPLPELNAAIDNALKEVVGISFESLNCEWNCVYVNGSQSCKFQVHVYGDDTDRFIVELNRLKGDVPIFRSAFSQLKSSILLNNDLSDLCSPEPDFCDLSPTSASACDPCSSSSSLLPPPSSSSSSPSCETQLPTLPEYNSLSVFTPLPSPWTLLTDSADSHGLGPITRMASQPFVESQIEASKIFCDLTAEESVRIQVCELNCVDILRDILMNSMSEVAQYYAVLALSNLSETRACQEYILNCGIIPHLFSLSTNGPYTTAEIRLLATFILANISNNFTNQIICLMTSPLIENYLQIVETIRDERCQLHACRLRDNLSSRL